MSRCSSCGEVNGVHAQSCTGRNPYAIGEARIACGHCGNLGQVVARQGNTLALVCDHCHHLEEYIKLARG